MEAPITPHSVVYCSSFVPVIHINIDIWKHFVHTQVQYNLSNCPDKASLYGPTNCLPTCKSPVQDIDLGFCYVCFAYLQTSFKHPKSIEWSFFRALSAIFVIESCQISQFETIFYSVEEAQWGSLLDTKGIPVFLELFRKCSFWGLWSECAITKQWTENSGSESPKTLPIWRNAWWI